MKQVIILMLFSIALAPCLKGQNQNVSINNDGSAPDPKAILDIKSIDKGILIPRMTTAQRVAITTPIKGLTVFDNTSNSFWYHSGVAWVELAPGWKLKGNQNTGSGDFLGTTDDQPLRIIVNNKASGSITNQVTRLTSFGYDALSANGTGTSNTAIGYSAMKNNTTGFNNTAVGMMSLFWNDVGYSNTSVGSSSLSQNRSGQNNTSLGAQAMEVNTTGNNNTALGQFSLRNNVESNDNTAVGYLALASVTSMENTAVGSRALQNAIAGFYNTALGAKALTATVGGYNNVAIGHQSLEANLSGFQNSAVGRRSLFINSTGGYNTSVGYLSLGGNVDGNYNTGLGTEALKTNTSGDRNTAVGVLADVSVGTLNNATALGYNAIVNASNAMLFGNTSVTKWGFGRNVTTGVLQVGDDVTNGNGAYLSAAGTWVNISDVHKKENITEIDGEELLKKIMALPINRWSYKGEKGVTHIGPMAQDFHTLFQVGDDDKAISSVDPSGVALRAIQEQQKMITAQQFLIEELLKRIDKLEKQR